MGQAGRPKGSLNKTTAAAKENVMAVFTRLGGTAAMAKWAKNNQTEFYKLYARLIPVEGSGPSGEHVFRLQTPWLTAAIAERNQT